MSADDMVATQKDKLLVIDDGKKLGRILKHMIEEIKPITSLGGINIHLRNEDDRKVEYVQFWFKLD